MMEIGESTSSVYLSFFFFLAIAMKMEIVRPMESLTNIQFSTIIFPIPVTSTAQILSVWTPCL